MAKSNGFAYYRGPTSTFGERYRRDQFGIERTRELEKEGQKRKQMENGRKWMK